jgi:hypothetical protein
MPGRSMILPDLPASSTQWAIVQPRVAASAVRGRRWGTARRERPDASRPRPR